MFLSKSGDIGGFQFSKVKLNTTKWNSTDHDERIAPRKVKNSPNLPIPTSSIPNLDFLILTIPLICLFLASITICLLHILKTSILSSPRTTQSQRKFQPHISPNINIIEPSYVGPAHDDDVHGVSCSNTEFIYLAPVKLQQYLN